VNLDAELNNWLNQQENFLSVFKSDLESKRKGNFPHTQGIKKLPERLADHLENFGFDFTDSADRIGGVSFAFDSVAVALEILSSEPVRVVVEILNSIQNEVCKEV
jgi:hypothetical protein